MRSNIVIDQIATNQWNSPREHDSKVSYTLVASGGLGGGYVPMIAMEEENENADASGHMPEKGCIQSIRC